MTESSAFDDAVRPTDWDEYIGQTRMKGRLELDIEAALTQERRLDDVFLLAPPGTGKTTLASLIAQQLFADFVAVTMPIKLDRFFDIIEELESGVVFIDELHSAPAAFQEMMQQALDEERVMTTPDGYKIDVSGIVFIGATITEFAPKILPPLRQRFEIQPAWEPYSDEDIAKILAGMARRMKFELTDEVCLGLAGACGSTPRLAKRFVKAARNLGAVGRCVTVDAVLDHVGVDADGLGSEHLQYLDILLEQGRMSLKNVAAQMYMTPAAAEDLEHVLRKKNLIFVSSAGRKITPAGRAKVKGRNKSNAVA